VRLLMSGVQSTNCKDEDLPESPRTLQEIRQQLVQPKKQEQNKSFFQLLLPAAPDDMPCVHFEEVMPLPISVLQTVNAEYPCPLTSVLPKVFETWNRRYSECMMKLITPEEACRLGQQEVQAVLDTIK